MNHRLSNSSFISRATSIHNGRYDYSKVVYEGSYNKVQIRCPLHGYFSQAAYAHLKGQGCPKCRYLKPGCNRIKSTYDFILDAIKVHGNAYDYSLVEYKNAKSKITICCRKHGEFRQTPMHHIVHKSGCPKCNSSRGEIIIRQWLETNSIPFKEQKTFPDCRNPKTNYPLKFDFYILGKHILIEYDGEQHFRPLFFGKNHRVVSDLQETKERDNIKNEYAQKHGIRLIRIPYFDFDHIPKILGEAIYES